MAAIKRTVFAQQAFDFSSFFTIQFARLQVAGQQCIRTPQLLAPESDSTGGGKQAIQHITLAPTTPGFQPVTVGWVNVPAKQAQLRTYSCLVKMHQQRGRPFDLDGNSYQQFFDQAKGFLAAQGMQVQIEMEPPPPSGGLPVDKNTSNTGKVLMYLFIGLAAFLLLAVVGVAIGLKLING